MLVLSRRIGQRIAIGSDITIVVNRVRGNRVTLGIEAPQSVNVKRSELPDDADTDDDVDTGNPVGVAA